MRMRRMDRALAAMLVALASASCASAPNPWRSHDRSAGARALASDLDRTCPVVVHNGTGQVLEALVDLDGVDRSLGLLAEGQSATVSVTCGTRRIHAKGIAQSLGLSEVARYSKSVLLDVTAETRLRLTWADQVR